MADDPYGRRGRQNPPSRSDHRPDQSGYSRPYAPPQYPQQSWEPRREQPREQPTGHQRRPTYRQDRRVQPDGRTDPVGEPRPDASPWHWLLWIPVIVPLMPVLYNDMDPRFLGLPFYYWGQLAFAGLASLVLTVVHLATKAR